MTFSGGAKHLLGEVSREFGVVRVITVVDGDWLVVASQAQTALCLDEAKSNRIFDLIILATSQQQTLVRPEVEVQLPHSQIFRIGPQSAIKYLSYSEPVCLFSSISTTKIINCLYCLISQVCSRRICD